jgi:hypothetical protein
LILASNNLDMKYFYFTLLAITFGITSCKNDKTVQEQGDPRLVVPFTQQSVSGLQNQSAAVATSQDHNLFHENNIGTTPSVVAGVNPAHGQPNHRCDVAVGAPLNTSVNSTSQVQSTNVQPTQVVTTTKSNSVKTVTAKGMNPPHGEKNHRCDIAVGAPLNSKPRITTNEKSDQVPQKYTLEQPVPALLSTAAPATETPSGMNPVHGKEGHRCGIAVGAPLPKS